MAQGPFITACAAVLARMWAIFRSNWILLLLAGLVIFVPLGLLETLDGSVQEAVGEADEIGLLEVLEVVGFGTLHAVGAVLGEVVFAGVVTAVMIVHHTGERVTVRELLPGLALGRLALADLAFVAIVVAGLIALIVPGLVFLVWFALLGPVIEVEHLGIRDAFRRSRELVRERFWLVAAFVLPITILDETLANLAHAVSLSTFGETFTGEWAGGSLTALLTSLPLALAAAVLYFELNRGGARSSAA